MTNFSRLAENIEQAFPHAEAPGEFRAYCQRVLGQGYDPQATHPNDDVDMALAYRGLSWWELSGHYSMNAGLAHRIETQAPLLDADVWRYYVPMFLLYYVHAMNRDDREGAAGHTAFLQSHFGEGYRQEEIDLLTLAQKQCIARVIKSAATDLPAGDSEVTAECAAYWSQFDQPAPPSPAGSGDPP